MPWSRQLSACGSCAPVPGAVRGEVLERAPTDAGAAPPLGVHADHFSRSAGSPARPNSPASRRASIVTGQCAAAHCGELRVALRVAQRGVEPALHYARRGRAPGGASIADHFGEVRRCEEPDVDRAAALSLPVIAVVSVVGRAARGARRRSTSRCPARGRSRPRHQAAA